MKFNEARFGLPKDYDIIATPDEINYIKENKDNDTLIGFYNWFNMISSIKTLDKVNIHVLRLNLILLLEYIDSK